MATWQRLRVEGDGDKSLENFLFLGKLKCSSDWVHSKGRVGAGWLWALCVELDQLGHHIQAAEACTQAVEAGAGTDIAASASNSLAITYR